MPKDEKPMATKTNNAFAEKTEWALASIAAKDLQVEAQGYAMIGGAMNYGEASLGTGLFGRISTAAKWFCIWFGIVVPVILFIRVV